MREQSGATIRSTARWLFRTGLVLLAIPAAYAVAALYGALLPRNAEWREPERGTEIFVRTNGIHSDLLLPARNAGVDWYALLPPGHAADPAAAEGWVAVGWGQRDFYLRTETWADLEPGIAVRAMLGGDALMHVGHHGRPQSSDAIRPVRLEPEGYRRMAAAIDATFRRERDGYPVPLRGSGYGRHDVFYEAEGVYHALRTSNQWTADMLAAAGVRIGVWTPFEQGIMWRFESRE